MSTVPDPDASLMLLVKQGDFRAFEQLVEKYKRPVMNLVYRTLPDATEAEDLAQHVFLQVFKSAHRYEVSAKFTTCRVSRLAFKSVARPTAPRSAPTARRRHRCTTNPPPAARTTIHTAIRASAISNCSWST